MNPVEGRPPDPTQLVTENQSDGMSLNTENLASSSPSLGNISFVPETCLTVGSQLGLAESSAGSSSHIEELLGGSVSRISSDMVAPLLGTIYGESSQGHSGPGHVQNNNNYAPPNNLTLASTGQKRIILIQPLDHTGRDLIYDPILTHELIYYTSGIFSNCLLYTSDAADE